MADEPEEHTQDDTDGAPVAQAGAAPEVAVEESAPAEPVAPVDAPEPAAQAAPSITP